MPRSRPVGMKTAPYWAPLDLGVSHNNRDGRRGPGGRRVRPGYHQENKEVAICLGALRTFDFAGCLVWRAELQSVKETLLYLVHGKFKAFP
ncbi:hypothetical protein NHX12_004137 [Muraenolepis orangiensis]|uniref:Uncharacterized protein n=1 Tax=Muraenolepis orangiensis TaxID=630683 RepID=A0A9Q0DUU2_9TELE|nr:hypothetical protein NHX12_004137 [Muraenolepis orangiensis]